MFHIAGGVFLGILAATWFLSFLEKRRIARELAIEMAPLRMSLPDHREFDGAMRWLVGGGLAFCGVCLVLLFAA